MCTQEAMYRKNDEYLKRKKKQASATQFMYLDPFSHDAFLGHPAR